MKNIFSLILLASPAAHAVSVTCEHYLNNPSLERTVETQVLDRIFTMNGREDVQGRAYAKLKLSTRLNEKSWHNVVLSLHRPKPRQPEALILQVGRFNQGEIVWGTQVGLLDDTPVLWRVMNLKRGERDLPYDELLKRHPMGPLDPGVFAEEFIGYATDPDVKGARMYLAARVWPEDDVVSIDLGLDVPCEDFGKYAGPGRPRLVRAASTTYCRISMMSFSANRLESRDDF